MEPAQAVRITVPSVQIPKEDKSVLSVLKVIFLQMEFVLNVKEGAADVMKIVHQTVWNAPREISQLQYKLSRMEKLWMCIIARDVRKDAWSAIEMVAMNLRRD